MSAQAGRAKMDVLLESQHRRQRILDFLNGNGPASVMQITAATGDTHKRITGTLALMRHRHEVASSGAKLAVRYSALIATTIDAQTMYNAIRDHAAVKAATAAADAAATRKRAKKEPWRTVHKGGENPAIKNQGGQGSLRRTVHINCQQHY